MRFDRFDNPADSACIRRARAACRLDFVPLRLRDATPRMVLPRTGR
jgi:hypothetical protein